MSVVNAEKAESCSETFEEVKEFDIASELDYYTSEFVDTLLEDSDVQDCGQALLLDRRGDEVLLGYQNGTQAFVGRDETASNAGIFGFAVTPGEPVPFVSSVDEALQLLEPVPVTEAVEDCDDSVVRQGEWFFVPADDSPESQVFKGGVGSRPYGESPLQNHVPRDYAFGASVQEIMERIEDRVPGLLDRVDEFEDLIEALSGMHEWHWLNSYIGDSEKITLQELYREVFGGVYVRGTVRHQRKDHGMISLGEQWYNTYTHALDVRSAGPDQIYD